MLKRAQERRTEEEPVAAKSRPACLVSRNLSAKKKTLLYSGASYGPANQELSRNFCFHKHSETSDGQTPESSSEFSSVAKR